MNGLSRESAVNDVSVSPWRGSECHDMRQQVVAEVRYAKHSGRRNTGETMKKLKQKEAIEKLKAAVTDYRYILLLVQRHHSMCDDHLS